MFVRHEPFWFNGSEFTLQTSADVFRYPLASEFLSIRGNVYCTPSGMEGSSRYAMKPYTVDQVEEMRFVSSEWNGWEASGRPQGYAIDLSGKFMLISPNPTTSGDTIFFRCTIDIGAPRYTATTTLVGPPALSPTITLTGPDGEALPANFTNAWFTDGFELIKSRAAYQLWSRYHGGNEAAQVGANSTLAAFLEEMQRLRSDTGNIQSVTRVRRYL